MGGCCLFYGRYGVVALFFFKIFSHHLLDFIPLDLLLIYELLVRILIISHSRPLVNTKYEKVIRITTL